MALNSTFAGAWQDGREDPFSILTTGNDIYAFSQRVPGGLQVYPLALASDGTFPQDPSFGKATPFHLQGNNNIHSESPASSAVAVAGDNFCFFWNDDVNGISAAISTDPSGQTAMPWYTLCYQVPGQSTPKPLGKLWNGSQGSDVAAVGFDDQTVLFGTLLGVATSNPQLFVAAYDTNPNGNPLNLVNGTGRKAGTWTTDTLAFEPSLPLYWTFPLSTLLSGLVSSSDLPNFSGSLHMDWYCGAAGAANGTQWLAVSFFNRKKQQAYVCWITIDAISSPILYLGFDPVQLKPSTVYAYSIGETLTTPVNLKRDPSGGIRMYAGANPSGSATLYTYTQPGGQDPTNTAPQMTALPCTVSGGSGNTALFVNATPPASTFLVGTTPISTPVVGQGNVNAYPVIEVVFASYYPGIAYTTDPTYGRVVKPADQEAAYTKTTAPAVLRGIFDGPFPVPNVNVTAWVQSGGTLPSNNILGGVHYGTSTSTTKTRSIQVSASVGIKSAGATTVGAGPAFDISMSAGAGTQVQTASATIVENNIDQDTVIDPQSHTIQSDALAFGNGMVFYSSYYQWLVPLNDGSGKFAPATGNSEWAVIYATPNTDQSVKLDYTPYNVTPGDLTSYTKEQWNATMSALGYPSSNYFDEVIAANAAYTQATTLNFASPSDAMSIQFGSSDFHELLWTFADSVYTGISVGGGLDFFGDGEEVQVSLLGGFTLNIQGTTSTEVEEDWGIYTDSFPLYQVSKPSQPIVSSYTVELYILPASNQWTNELRTYAPSVAKQIDPNSQPWRVAFLVTQIAYTDGTSYGALSDATPSAPSLGSPIVWELQNTFPESVWQSGAQVQYGVCFAVANNSSQTTWMASPVTVPSGCGSYPQVTIPVDNSTGASNEVRKLYRTVNSGPAQLVKVINNNTDTTCYDDDPAYSIYPLSNGPNPITVGAASSRSNVPYTDAFIPGNQVQYSFSYMFEPAGSGGNGPAFYPESAVSQPTALWQVTIYGCPVLENIPTFNQSSGAPTCVGRRIYRSTFQPNPTGGGTQQIETNVLVIQINDNTTTSAVDTGQQPNVVAALQAASV